MSMPDSAPSAFATKTQLLAATGLLTGLLAAFASGVPLGATAGPGSEALLPAYAAAATVLETVTAALLLSLYGLQRSTALLVLACGYIFNVLMMPAWALTFPVVFATFGLDFGAQTAAVIDAIRRLAFPLVALGYALAPTSRGTTLPAIAPLARTMILAAAGAGLALCFFFAFAPVAQAPVADTSGAVASWRFVPVLALALYALSAGLLLLRRRNLLDVWMSLVLLAFAMELVLFLSPGGSTRLSVGWWAGRSYELVAVTILPLVLISEVTTVFARMARLAAAERRSRQNRLVAMEAFSATIAHEIRQPLASMITNAGAARNWLGRDKPQLDEVDEALRRIVSDGHRVDKIIAGIRAMFVKGAQERQSINLNTVVQDAASAAAGEADLDGIQIETDFKTDISVFCNPVQLHQVICNLIQNGIDAVREVGDRQRRIRIATERRPGGEVHVTVADTGTGVSPDMADSIFEPFVSTKTGGMGMGLMFCRSVVEAHRGRLWVTANAPRGAVFHIALPAEAPLTLGTVPIRVEPAPAVAATWADRAEQFAG
ncbi:MAG: MASE4 domain-containing protein [Alphaproteobacteria bacterium]|nr:MASE4 domain-containing protein [Alphaproteobacteria bacterium]